ncbi:MAG TPA: transcriptional regulator [Pseudomonadales bacterium]
MKMNGMEVFEFAGFLLDAGARQLRRLDGSHVKLSSRAFDMLVLLVAHRGETLTKRRLLRDVWPDVVVGENNLNQAVVAIRRALGDNTEPRRLVQTVPGRGFCFVGDVRIDAAMQAVAASEPVYTVADYFSAP